MTGPALLARRALGGLFLLLAACGGLSRPGTLPDLLAALESQDPSERSYAVAELARRRAPEAVPGLVGRLRDEDGGIRLFAVAALRDMTGEDRGFRPFDPPAEREAAVLRWETWLVSRGGP